MELTRRSFNGWLVLALGMGVGGGWFLLKQSVPPRVVSAIRARRYPGRVVPLDEKRVSNMGPWNG